MITKGMLDNVSPENFFIHTGDIGEPVVEMGEKKNPLNIRARNYYDKDGDYQSDLMTTIIYNTEDNTLEIRGRMRFVSGNKSVFKGKDKLPYSEENLAKLKLQLDNGEKEFRNLAESLKFYEAEPMELNFEIGEDMDSIIKKLNDSNRFNIGIPTKQPEKKS